VTSDDRAGGSASTPPDAGNAPVTTTVTRRVKPGHEVLYEEFLEGIISAASEFPGHLGVEVFRPKSATAGDYRTVYRSTAPSTCAPGSIPTSTAPGWRAPSRM
jgi:antibiotic biosynthesis monooxygenase (ABM) superfamily enzyme